MTNNTPHQEEVKNLVQQLDSLIPKDNAKVEMRLYGGGPDESQMVATENGYLRFGVELMKGALMPPNESDRNDSVHVDLDYLTSGQSEICFAFFRRVDSFPPPPSADESLRTRIIETLLACGCIGFLLCALVGMGVVVTWIAKAIFF